MNLQIAQNIRNAEHSRRFTLLLEELFGPGAGDRSGLVNQMQMALRNLRSFRLSVSRGYHMTIMPPDDSKKPIRKVIITENEHSGAIKREYATDVYAYDFLRDYLGLGGEEPYSVARMQEAYPDITREGGQADEDWYDALAREIIKGAKRQIVGPSKKYF